MNEIIAIISEYNPFHNGHKYQIEKIKEMYPEALIISIMSGNVTQRGDFALMDKYIRAKAAVLCGSDCVFEIPYPFCSSSAEVFAGAGVFLAMSLGATHLCFGIEMNDLSYVTNIADALEPMSGEDIKKMAKQDRSISYPKLLEKIYPFVDDKIPHMSNLILGVEYVRSIRKYGNLITPISIKREGYDYNDLSVGTNMSAAAIREYFLNNNSFISIPPELDSLYKSVVDEKLYTDIDNVRDFIFRSVLRMTPQQIESSYDTPSGMGYFISDTAKDSACSKDFFESLTTKTYTYARMRRVVLYSLFGIQAIDSEPAYTVLLASSAKGRRLLKKLKKEAAIPILTKLADYKSMNSRAASQFEISSKADELFTSFIKKGVPSRDFIKQTPYISE